ncbi:MAG: S49 family peptidase [Prevotellaceae bacterium]|jgi:protease-4|nr:S49 family peptidase [Prevotellaceae bacterium]
MQYSFIKELVTSTWAIDALTMQMYAPILGGVFAGLHFDREPTDADNIPYTYNIKAHVKQDDGDTSKFHQIYVQPLRGIMMKRSTESGITGTERIAEYLLDADQNPEITGHILLIDSGGGQTGAVPVLADAIQKLTKPIVAFVDGMMCSAAMHAGSYCNRIIASRNTDSIGCIGTVVELSGFPKFNKEPDGYTRVRIYADASSEKNEEYEAALTGDFKLIKERILNPANQRFIADIKANRPNVMDEHLKGRTFTAAEVTGTLIDSIGDFQSAVEAVIELSKSKKKNHNSKNMTKNKTKLTALLACLALTELAIEDGQTSLNEQQLEAIDSALLAGSKVEDELAAAKLNLQQANTDINECDRTIKTLNEKIAELEKSAGAASAAAVVDDEPSEINLYANVLNELKSTKKTI